MKKVLFISGLLLVAFYNHAQQLQVNAAYTDSLRSKYKHRKTTGLVLLPTGCAAFLSGAVIYLSASASEAGDELGNAFANIGSAFAGGGEVPYEKTDYSGKYTTGSVLMIGGAILTVVGITQLVSAHKVRKKMMNASVSYMPTYVPALQGASQPGRVPQSTVSLKIPIGK